MATVSPPLPSSDDVDPAEPPSEVSLLLLKTGKMTLPMLSAGTAAAALAQQLEGLLRRRQHQVPSVQWWTAAWVQLASLTVWCGRFF